MGSQCYLTPGRGDIPALTPAEAGTRLNDPGGVQGWVDLVCASIYGATGPHKSVDQTTFRSAPLFCRTHRCTQHRHTDHGTCEVCSNRPHYIALHAMRANNIFGRRRTCACCTGDDVELWSVHRLVVSRPRFGGRVGKVVSNDGRRPGWLNTFRNQSRQEAQLSPRDRAMCCVSWNLANCHATVQKLLVCTTSPEQIEVMKL